MQDKILNLFFEGEGLKYCLERCPLTELYKLYLLDGAEHVLITSSMKADDVLRVAMETQAGDDGWFRDEDTEELEPDDVYEAKRTYEGLEPGGVRPVGQVTRLCAPSPWLMEAKV